MGATTTVQCAAGKYAEPDIGECLDCDPGFVSTTAATSCTACSPGTYEVGNQCVECAPGSANAKHNVTACTSCSAGHVAPDPGMRQCRPCSKGEQPDAARADCLECAPSERSDGSQCISCGINEVALFSDPSVCVACEPGEVRSDGFAVCTECGKGSARAADATQCEQCVPGRRDNGWRSCRQWYRQTTAIGGRGAVADPHVGEASRQAANGLPRFRRRRAPGTRRI